MPQQYLTPGASNSGGPATSGGTWTPYGSTTSPVLYNLAGQPYFDYDRLGVYQYQYSVSSSCGTFSSVYSYEYQSANLASVDRNGEPACTFCLNSANEVVNIVETNATSTINNNLRFNVTAIQGLTTTSGIFTTSSTGSLVLRTPSGSTVGTVSSLVPSTSAATVVSTRSLFIGGSANTFINVGTNTSGTFTLNVVFSPNPGACNIFTMTPPPTFNWIKTSAGGTSLTDSTATNISGTYQSNNSLGSKSNLCGNPLYSSAIANGVIHSVKYTATTATYKLGAGTPESGYSITASSPSINCAVLFSNNAVTGIGTSTLALTTGVTTNLPSPLQLTMRRANWSTLAAPSTMPGTYEVIYAKSSSVCGDSYSVATITNSSAVIKQFPIQVGLNLNPSVTNVVSMNLVQILSSNPNINAIKALAGFSGITWSTIGCIIAIPISASLLKDESATLSLTDVDISNLQLRNGTGSQAWSSISTYAVGQFYPHSASGGTASRYALNGTTFYGAYTSGGTYAGECALYIAIPKASGPFPTISGNKTIMGMGCTIGFTVNSEKVPGVTTPNTNFVTAVICPEQTF